MLECSYIARSERKAYKRHFELIYTLYQSHKHLNAISISYSMRLKYIYALKKICRWTIIDCRDIIHLMKHKTNLLTKRVITLMNVFLALSAFCTFISKCCKSSKQCIGWNVDCIFLACLPSFVITYLLIPVTYFLYIFLTCSVCILNNFIEVLTQSLRQEN